MTKRKAQRGDIIKLTKLRDKMIAGGAASEAHPAFFRVEATSSRQLMAMVLFMPKKMKFRDEARRLGYTWAIANDDVTRHEWGDGKYEIVSGDEVPDYVWAELAKQALLGEIPD